MTAETNAEALWSDGDGLATSVTVVDTEGRVSIDHGAVRFAPTRQAGWGREGLAFRSFESRSGLAFGVLLLNGHNGSHSGPIDGGLRRRFVDWALGPRDRSARARATDFLRSKRRREALWLWGWWLRRSPRLMSGDTLDDNLVVGWFEQRVPRDPLGAGRCVVVRSNAGENALLGVSLGDGKIVSALEHLVNVPMYYLIVLSETGAVHYAGSTIGVAGLPVVPEVRPLAIVRRPAATRSRLHPGVHQSVLGQVGFSADTRVYDASIQFVPEWSKPWTSAHVADRLSGADPLATSRPDHGGGLWRAVDGAPLVRTVMGVESSEPDGAAWLETGITAGLVAAMIVSGPRSCAGVLFRVRDDQNHWRITVADMVARLGITIDGRYREVAAKPLTDTPAGQPMLLQVVDDGRSIRVHLDATAIAGGHVADERLAQATGVGVCVGGPSARVSDLEAHPRSLRAPEGLGHRPLPCPSGQTVELSDDLKRGPGDLDGRRLGDGIAWQRLSGAGQIRVVPGGGARVSATRDSPNVGRTVYAVPWIDSGVADIEVEITPPGSSRGEGHQGRGGVVFWQDPDHMVIVNNWIDDGYPGASISMFCRLGPFEDVFRAVWTNVGERVSPGTSHRLRVAFDGSTLVARVDGNAVLYRAISDIHSDAAPIRVRHVGLVANWEWGNDTGTTFRNFVVRSDRPRPAEVD